MQIELSNERWSDEYFKQEREKALALWPTGKEVDLEEAISITSVCRTRKGMPR